MELEFIDLTCMIDRFNRHITIFFFLFVGFLLFPEQARLMVRVKHMLGSKIKKCHILKVKLDNIRITVHFRTYFILCMA